VKAIRCTASLSCALSIWVTTPARAQAPSSLTDSAFAALSARLSEPGGYFDTDNLISNEDSYLHPLTTLRRVGVMGGVYVGVGPDQNFSYIAAIRPRVAFIVDIRRDNLLEHLLFKGIFALSSSRADYLSLLFGRRVAVDTTGQSGKSIAALLTELARAPPDTMVPARVLARVRRLGIPLSSADLSTIARFHSTFVSEGPSLRFNTHGRAPQWYDPEFRQLAAERDRNGREASFLASEDAFRFVKSLEDHNLVILVVGDFAGPHALSAVAGWMKLNHESLSAMYTSNVEQYLFRNGGFDAFARNVSGFPRDAKSVMIRSCFMCQGQGVNAVDGYHAVQSVQLVDTFVASFVGGRLRQYWDLIGAGFLPP